MTVIRLEYVILRNIISKSRNASQKCISLHFHLTEFREDASLKKSVILREKIRLYAKIESERSERVA